MSETPELLPCPFCGGIDCDGDGPFPQKMGRVHCHRCGADGPTIPYAPDSKFWEWNTRSPAARNAALEDAAKAVDVLQDACVDECVKIWARERAAFIRALKGEFTDTPPSSSHP